MPRSQPARTDVGPIALARVLEQVRDKYCSGSNRELARRIGRSEYLIRSLIRPLVEPEHNPNPSPDTLHDIWRYLEGLDEYRGLTKETVFEWAGQLPPRPMAARQLNELQSLLEQLSERDRREVLEYVRLKAKLAEERLTEA